MADDDDDFPRVFVEEFDLPVGTVARMYRRGSLESESPLVWERPHIVSTRGATAGTPRPQGWEAHR
jgi:hypothetical protein